MRLSKILLLLISLSLLSLTLPSTSATASQTPIAQNSSSDQTEPYDQRMVGPFRFWAAGSSQFGAVFGAKWNNYLTKRNAFGFEVNFGGDEFRIAGTWGLMLTELQRIKITAEHLAQSQQFNFAAGPQQQWIGQNEIAATYQYLLPHWGWIKSFSLNGYLLSAENEDLEPEPFIQDDTEFVNLEHITGASGRGANVGVDIQPWQASLVNVALNYDSIRYAAFYEAPKNSSGVGVTVNLQQIITDHLKLEASASDRAPFNQYQGGIFVLVPTRPGTRFELSLRGSYVTGNIPTGTDGRIIAGMAISWGGSRDSAPAIYTLPADADLSAWTDIPAIYMPDILVMRDQKILLVPKDEED